MDKPERKKVKPGDTIDYVSQKQSGRTHTFSTREGVIKKIAFHPPRALTTGHARALVKPKRGKTEWITLELEDCATDPELPKFVMVEEGIFKQLLGDSEAFNSEHTAQASDADKCPFESHPEFDTECSEKGGGCFDCIRKLSEFENGPVKTESIDDKASN